MNAVERPDAVTLMGNSYTLIGPELKVGDKAPDFLVLNRNLKPVTLVDTQGRIRIFSVVPSIDTPVCDIQTRRFNSEAADLPGVRVYTISMDLPFAQSRWCTTAGVDKIEMLSDHREASFGLNYGTLIKELRLECRAIFVLDESDTITHVEYVRNIGDHPNYEAALAAVKSRVRG